MPKKAGFHENISEAVESEKVPAEAGITFHRYTPKPTDVETVVVPAPEQRVETVEVGCAGTVGKELNVNLKVSEKSLGPQGVLVYTITLAVGPVKAPFQVIVTFAVESVMVPADAGMITHL